jgi:glycosyltransferase involved in cell wall biosynthesis
MKPPDDPAPSGDRLIARQFMALLQRLGFEVELASRLRTRCRTPQELPDVARMAEAEIERILAAERRAAEPASLVFTYHNYYRAPDLIGPRLARALGVHYAIAESSRAPKRATGHWAAGHGFAEAASDAARLILAPTAHDLAMLERLRPGGQTVAHLPPFLDLADRRPRSSPVPRRGWFRLITVAMMRLDNKLDSYLALAGILSRLDRSGWTLDIVGDGAGRAAVEAAFAPFAEQVRFHGLVTDRGLLDAMLAEADAFVWPAVEEPIGMAFLEAQAQGLPCLAYAYRGVPDVVADGVSGHLVAPGDAEGFARRLESLMQDRASAAAMGQAARLQVERRHTLERAVALVTDAFRGAELPLPPR